MSAQATRLASAVLVVGDVTHATFTRSSEVVFTPGRVPRIDIRRSRPDGSEAGVLMLHSDVFAALWSALRAIREGSRYSADAATPRGAIRFVVREEDTLEILIVGSSGAPRGGPSILRGEELVHLAEALRLARHEEDGR